MTEQKLQFLVCSLCNGFGEVREKECPQCRGMEIVGFLDGYLLYSGQHYTKLQVYTFRVQKYFRILGIVFLSLIGVLGIVSFGYHFYVTNSLPLTLESIAASTSPLIRFFWFSLFCDLYLIYILSKKKHARKPVVQKSFSTGSDMPLLPKSWEEVSQYPKSQSIDVSDSLAEKTEKIIIESVSLAEKYQADILRPSHILASLLTHSTLIGSMLVRLQISATELADRLNRVMLDEPTSGMPLKNTAESQKIFIQAYKEAYKNKQKEVTEKELFLISVMTDERIQEVFYDLGVTKDMIADMVAWMRTEDALISQYKRYRSSAQFRSKSGLDRALTSASTPYLNHYGEDLTLLAKLGYLEMTVGRSTIYEELFRLYQGSSKAALLIAEDGIGKTSCIEGLAQKIVGNDVPEFLKEKRLVRLSIPQLLSGASATEAHSRMLIVLNEIVRAKNVILCIEHIDDIMGITAGTAESLDLASVLSEGLESGAFFFISSTTPTAYRDTLEGSTLGGQLVTVSLPEVSESEGIRILQTKVGAIESKHGVFFSYQSLRDTIELTNRFVQGKMQPLKSVQVLEELAVYVKQRKGKKQLVTSADVSELLSSKLHMPVAQATQSEAKKLLYLDDQLHKRVIGQEEAVQAVTAAMKRAGAQLRDENRPISNFLFLGPTGVGKTELSKALAEMYFGSDETMVRLDMSEYQDPGSINKLIGGGGQNYGVLTQAIKENPYTIVLLDELEKAHPDILNAFLQVMEDGRLTDVQGFTADFSNAIIIATSNAGAQYIQDQVNAGVDDVQHIKQVLVEEKLREHFKPEFINRFDAVVVFKPLTLEELKKITRLLLAKVQSRLEDKGITLKVTDEAVAELAQAGYDPQFGARPLRRVIQNKVDTALADVLLKGEVSRRDIAVLDAGGIIRIDKAKEL